VTVFERSLLVAQTVFMEENRGLLDLSEFHLLESLCSWGSQRFEQDAHKIYLKCDQEVMVNRVVRRARSSERGLR
jgi:deoxyadenosine/deoxycytidine kinase